MEDSFSNLDKISYSIDEVNDDSNFELNLDNWANTELPPDIDWLEPTDLSDGDLYRGTI